MMKISIVDLFTDELNKNVLMFFQGLNVYIDIENTPLNYHQYIHEVTFINVHACDVVVYIGPFTMTLYLSTFIPKIGRYIIQCSLCCGRSSHKQAQPVTQKSRRRYSSRVPVHTYGLQPVCGGTTGTPIVFSPMAVAQICWIADREIRVRFPVDVGVGEKRGIVQFSAIQGAGVRKRQDDERGACPGPTGTTVMEWLNS